MAILASGSFVRAEQSVEAHRVIQIDLHSSQTYTNPFMEVELNALVTRPDGRQMKVPAFWDGGDRWCFRYASEEIGQHKYRMECSDAKNRALNGVEGVIRVVASKSDNPLYRHGPIRIAADHRHFEHVDGTPFFWLGDTWWKDLCKRMTWEGFQELTADRKAKGFTLVQIVCGTYPDEGLFEASWENEGGKPYEDRKFTRMNPKYFDYADRRIKCLVDAGIVPAIVGSWGRPDCDGMAMVGVEGMKRHWRNLIAHYGAYPTVWIIAGEAGGPKWDEVTKYVKKIDPYQRPATIHTGRIDFTMIGGNHDATVATKPQTLAIFTNAYAQLPPVPVLCGETSYEEHMQQAFQDVQRQEFWMYMLHGAAGHTYGAAGVWHASVPGDPGITPVYDWTTWREGMNYPGSTQLGLCKKLLEKYPWQKFETHPEWVDADCYAAGIPGQVRFIYMPKRGIYNWSGPTVKNLEPDVDWHVFYFDPATGRTFDQGTIKASAKTGEKASKPVDFNHNAPSPQDWVLVFEKAKS